MTGLLNGTSTSHLGGRRERTSQIQLWLREVVFIQLSQHAFPNMINCTKVGILL